MALSERPADGPPGPPASGLSTPSEAPDLTTPRADAWAWGVCWLMFASTVLNYLDRQTVAQVGTPLIEEFGLSATGFGWLMAVFSLTYALCQVPAGYLVDRRDVRRTYAGAVAFWSLAGLSVAFCPVLVGVMALRALLGVGESFNWPCALRVTGRVLPPADRSLGNGIFNSGAAVGAVLAPLIVTPLAERFGWRMPFLLIGSAGFVWVAVWLLATGGSRRAALSAPAPKSKPDPAEDPDGLPTPAPQLSESARRAFGGVVLSALAVAVAVYWFGPPALMFAVAWLMLGLLVVARALPETALRGVEWAESLGEVVRLRRFWVLVVVAVTINACWHFLVSWVPHYLKTDRHMTYLASGLWAAVPFLAADAGNLAGGALSRALAGEGNPVRARLTVMSLCALLISGGAWVGAAASNAAVITLLAVMAFGTAAFMANYFAFTQEVDPRHTGLIVGYLGGLGNLMAAGVIFLAGYVKDQTGAFAPVFIVVGLVPFVGLGALAAGWGGPGRSPEPGPKAG